jgi:DNA repair ATPase RecN
MKKIAEVYLNKAIDIRKEFKKNLNYILEKEKLITKYKNEIEKSYNEIEYLMNNNDNNENIKEIYNNKLAEIEKNIIKVQTCIKPYSDKIEILKKESQNLYIAVVEKYPTMDIEDIKKQIIDRIILEKVN